MSYRSDFLVRKECEKTLLFNQNNPLRDAGGALLHHLETYSECMLHLVPVRPQQLETPDLRRRPHMPAQARTDVEVANANEPQHLRGIVG